MSIVGAVLIAVGVILPPLLLAATAAGRRPTPVEVHPCQREQSMPQPRWVFEHERYWTCPTCGAEWYIAGSGGGWDGYWLSGYWKRLTTGRTMSPPIPTGTRGADRYDYEQEVQG